MMKRIFLVCFCVSVVTHLQAQEIIRISRTAAEGMFLQNNLLLISKKLHIELQKAQVIQAKLWPNPTFSITEINLWATQRQTGAEVLAPPLWGDFGKNLQFGLALEQLIQTAGKRKKRVELEQVELAKAEQYFEDLLRELKLEFRNELTNLQYLQQAIKVHQHLIDNMSKLTQGYKKQLEKSNISTAEYIRLKAQELELNKEILELTNESHKSQKTLKLLLHLDSRASIEITDQGFIKDMNPYKSVFMVKMMEDAIDNRPDYKLTELEQNYANNLFALEKAQRVPDVTFGVQYDRSGGIMLDFVGFGVAFDLPFFNRNKGNIKKAQISIEYAKMQKEQKKLAIESEVFLAYKALQQAIHFINNIEPEYENDMDTLLEHYTKNFISRNVSMLEYFDFMDAYLKNKKIILEARKNINQKAEELNYTLGRDF